MKPKHIEVIAARTQRAVEDKQGDVAFDYFDTIGEARRKAKHYLTDEYQRTSEASEPLNYAQVCVNGECVADYFRKGYNGDQP